MIFINFEVSIDQIAQCSFFFKGGEPEPRGAAKRLGAVIFELRLPEPVSGSTTFGAKLGAGSRKSPAPHPCFFSC